MGAQNSLLALIGAAGVAASKITTSVKDNSSKSENTKSSNETQDQDSGFKRYNEEIRIKALKKAQKEIDAINAQNLGRNNRMKAIRGVISDFAESYGKGGNK